MVTRRDSAKSVEQIAQDRKAEVRSSLGGLIESSIERHGQAGFVVQSSTTIFHWVSIGKNERVRRTVLAVVDEVMLEYKHVGWDVSYQLIGGPGNEAGVTFTFG